MLNIIIPAYNCAGTISNTIKSILEHSYNNLEIIVVDDGSSDETLQILRNISLSDKRVRVISTSNGGVSRARNIGLDNLSDKAKYIAFVDSDDIVVNNIYEKTIDLMELKENQDVGILTFSCSVKDYEGNGKDFILRNEKKDSATVRESISYDNVEYGGGYIWNRIIRRDAAFKKGIVYFREDLKYYEDKLWLLDLLESDMQVLTVPEIGYEYYVREKTADINDMLEYMVGLKEIVLCPNLSPQNDLTRKIIYAKSFAEALDYAIKNELSEAVRLLNEWLQGESEELQKLLAITYSRISGE